MIRIVFGFLFISNFCAYRINENLIQERQGQLNENNELQAQEYSEKLQQCFDNELEAKHELENVMKFDENTIGFGDGVDVYEQEEKRELKDSKKGNKIFGFGKGKNVYEEEERKEQNNVNDKVRGFGKGEDVYEDVQEINKDVDGFGKGVEVYEVEKQEKESSEENGFGEALGTIDDYEQQMEDQDSYVQLSGNLRRKA
ncbi:unnamed protein product (macronuclear) [Paramecium tetraurelia]|uniref:Uncharacterized protein n=1 Tax=Paramecium tetraurelia TaxID=5888 RepID=A0E385_PARTE|nr:uncharacterized protein GSPATT00022925001 [Paramecium tetraurelia]CAK89752.1 unnamed protein product [Paramecium tetraurelia]|eukprot:XP_001457149.1 hypothetical protein (macronuclear) [Paramecium tetraurelia strain d4-2]